MDLMDSAPIKRLEHDEFDIRLLLLGPYQNCNGLWPYVCLVVFQLQVEEHHFQKAPPKTWYLCQSLSYNVSVPLSQVQGVPQLFDKLWNVVGYCITFSLTCHAQTHIHPLHTCTHTHKHTYMHAYYTKSKISRQTDRKEDRQIDNLTDRQMNKKASVKQ